MNTHKIIINDEEFTDVISKLNRILKNIDLELEKRNFKGFNSELSEKIHKFFNTKKYQYFIERENKLKASREIMKLQDILHILVKPTELLKEYGFDVKNFEDDHFWQIWEEQSNRLHKTPLILTKSLSNLDQNYLLKLPKYMKFL
ncbi:hypothetical protein [Rickettsia helvetica]|uniref:Uncharacterized protein n=1 Tax=Rickettsia helvetica TaxID=35789 RepID=A0ABM9NAB4_RICHE|nr:hypothetical protein [Rickettsia helvetica]MCZ6884167.1 hypothetical protein [Rickettsia endosymbiont of Ixodes ricinus]MCZ6896142.1 hypothetical protein [Rickettsia endosymbiont of Ixodes ricinus]